MKLEELYVESKKKINEDGEGGGMAAGGEGAAPAPIANPTGDSAEVVDNSGIRDEDVLGKWDPAKGFMAKGDFHIPKNVLGKGKYLKRYEIPSKKKKGQKNIYAKGMQILEAEVNQETVNAIHNLEHSQIVDFVKETDPSAKLIMAIVYCPTCKLYFIRYLTNDRKIKFIIADFDKDNFVKNGDKIFTAEEVKKTYKLAGTKPSMWVVWGEMR